MGTAFKYYADAEQTKMKTELVDGEARKHAKSFVSDCHPKDKIKASQLRKFYADVKSCEAAWRNAGTDGQQREAAFSAVLPRIKILKAKVAYARGRNVVPEAFAFWLKNCVDAVENSRDFEAFLMHFEAVVGYCYGEGLKD